MPPEKGNRAGSTSCQTQGLSSLEKRSLRRDLLVLSAASQEDMRGGAEVTLGIRRHFLAREVIKPCKGSLERGFGAMP